ASGATNPLTVTVTSSMTVTANFSINQYTVSVDSTAGGSTDQDGAHTINHGDTLTIAATPDTGYHFTGWSGDASGTSNPVTVTVTSAMSITANFSINQYTVNVDSSAAGSTDQDGAHTIDDGDTLTIAATPDTGYHFTGWSGDASGTTNPLTVTVTSNMTVTASFAINQYTVDVSADIGGSVSPSGATTVTHGGGLSLTATAASGYVIDTWSVDGEVVQLGGASYTLSDVQSDRTVEVTFSATTYTITSSADPGGSIEPDGETEVEHGQYLTLTAIPQPGYRVGQWLLDGVVVQTGIPTYEIGPEEDHTIRVTFVQTMSQSLGTFDFDDEEDWEDGISSNNTEEPEETVVFVEPVGLGQDPEDVAMGLRNRKDDQGRTVSARVKGTFIKTSADEVLIRFKYLFTTHGVELKVYISDSPLLLAHDDPLRDQHYILAATLGPPPFPRPGSVGSERFAVFQKIVWTGTLDFSEGLYIELELVEPSISGILLAGLSPRVPAGDDGGSVYIDNWSTEVQCYGICLDINWDNFVDEADFLTVIGACGCDATGDTACLEGAFSTDGYMDSYDVASWDWAMNSDQRLLNYCGLPLTGGLGGIQMMSVSAALPAPEASGRVALFAGTPYDLSDLLVLGKRGAAEPSSKLRDCLYTFTSDGRHAGSFEPTSDRGNIRLIQGPDGEIYRLNCETGLLRSDGTDEVIVPAGKLGPADFREPRYGRTATVYVGIQGSDADSFGRPVLDVAMDAEYAYVVPVVVSPEGGQAYLAAAKLKLLGAGNPPYELVELYDEPPLVNDNQYRDSLREIELDGSGNVYVLNVNSLNESDILWRFTPDGAIDRLDLGRPDGASYVPAPVAMHVSKTSGMLYLASAALDPTNPESSVVYAFSTVGDLALEKSIEVKGVQHVTSMTEDPQTSALWVAGFTMYHIPLYPNPTRPAFYYPHLARISADGDDVQTLPLFDSASHDLALPMSVLWTGTAGQNGVQ
ncbi:MAG: InlB B-repeat-containing protein, partial [Planctomycetota bacterium]